MKVNLEYSCVINMVRTNKITYLKNIHVISKNIYLFTSGLYLKHLVNTTIINCSTCKKYN